MSDGTPRRLAGPGPVAGGVTLFTTSSIRLRVTEILLANPTASDGTVSAWINTADDAHVILPDVTVPANTVVVFSLATVLERGDVLLADGTGAAVAVTVSGEVFTE